MPDPNLTIRFCIACTPPHSPRPPPQRSRPAAAPPSPGGARLRGSNHGVQRCKSGEWDTVGDELKHAAGSRRPPIPLDTMVARADGYAYAATVWDLDLSIVQEPVFCRPVPNLSVLRFATCASLYGGDRPAGVLRTRARTHLLPVRARAAAAQQACRHHLNVTQRVLSVHPASS